MNVVPAPANNVSRAAHRSTYRIIPERRQHGRVMHRRLPLLRPACRELERVAWLSGVPPPNQPVTNRLSGVSPLLSAAKISLALSPFIRNT